MTRTQGLAMVDAPQGRHRGRPRSGQPARGTARMARPQASDSDQRHRGGTPGRPGVDPAPAGAAATFSFGRVSSRNRSTAPGSSGEGNRSRNRPLAADHPKIPREDYVSCHVASKAPGCHPTRMITDDCCRICLFGIRDWRESLPLISKLGQRGTRLLKASTRIRTIHSLQQASSRR